jgi:uncharacterized protein YbjQ (UPF0145 family)
MKNKIALAALLAASLVSFSASAGNTMVKLPIAGAMAANDAQARLGDSVKFYFGDQPTPRVLKVLGSDSTSQRTNGFGKSTEKSCNWVFLSAMLQLQKHAKDVGANAIINIVSNYDHNEMSSRTEFECADGAIMSGVAFKADFVKVAE